MFKTLNLQPGLSGNPFLWLEKLWQKDWERRTEIAAQIIKLIKVLDYLECVKVTANFIIFFDVKYL